MYSAQHVDPNTRLFGAATAVLMTFGVGYALLVTTMGGYIVPPSEPTVLVTLEAPKSEPMPETPLALPTDDLASKPDDTVQTLDLPTFTAVEPTVPTAPSTVTGSLSTTVVSRPVAPAAPMVGPRLRDGSEPVYPPASVRAQEQGTTSLEVCISERGRVTDAKVQTSSGYRRLDDAALQWVREARFAPARSGSDAKAICGHLVHYQFELKNAR